MEQLGYPPPPEMVVEEDPPPPEVVVEEDPPPQGKDQTRPAENTAGQASGMP